MIKHYIALFILFLFSFHSLIAQWNPDAAYIPTLTKSGTAYPSSGVEAGKVIDGDLTSPWKSENPLPVNYMMRPDENIFLNQGNTLFDSPGVTDFTRATDGNISSTLTTIPLVNNRASLTVDFPVGQNLVYFSMKANAGNLIQIYAFSSPVDSVLIGMHPAGNFSTIGYLVDNNLFSKLKLYASASFDLFEFAGLSAPPKESVTVDLGSVTSIGSIRTKHWAGINTAVGTKLYISNNAVIWNEVATLDPNSTEFTETFLPTGTSGQYIKLEHWINLEATDGVFIFEIEAYDEDGLFGATIQPTVSTHKLKDIVGINSVWGWGTGVSSNNLSAGQGPTLHNRYATHARNYHFMNWDMLDPDDPVDFDQMAEGCPIPGCCEDYECGDCPPLDCWLDWDVEYQAWVDAGLMVQATLQFDLSLNFGLKWEEAWDKPYTSAYNYGYSFARHFGPTFGNGLVRIIEVGNEPWFYDASIYREILAGMTTGAKAADAAVAVFPCALQAYDPAAETTPELGYPVFRNYMGTRITEAIAPYLDGINIHNYSFIKTKTGERIAVHPEHPGSEFNGIRSAVRFRDNNMPGKEIFLSEWGWDSNSANEDCVHSECVSDEAAAIYTARGTMIAHRHNLDRATCFFYANEDKPSSLFTRSGLTESKDNNYKIKKNFIALESLVGILGDYHFIDAYQENESGYIYEYGNADGTVTHLVAWLPIDGDAGNNITIYYPSNMPASTAVRVDGENLGGTSIALPPHDGNGISLSFGTAPLIISLDDACPVAGTPCNDGNPNTIDDQHDGNCNCSGNCPVPGTPCDDGDPNSIDDQYNGYCICAGTPVGEGCELITNGSFDNDVDNWGTSACTAVFYNRQAKIIHIATGDDAWDAFFHSETFPLVQGGQYIVNFRASATTNRTMGFKLGLGETPYTYYSGGVVNLTPAMQNFAFVFTMDEAYTAQARLEFHVASSTSEIILDNISLMPVDCDDTLPGDCEMIPDGSFNSPLNSWVASNCTPFYNNDLAEITNITVGNDEWAASFQSNDFSLAYQQEYTLNFSASASTNRTISLQVYSGTTFYYYAIVNVTTTVQDYSYTFTDHYAAAPAATLQFNLGENAADVLLDNVSLVPTDCSSVTTQAGCDILVKEEFFTSLNNWNAWGCTPNISDGRIWVSDIFGDGNPLDAGFGQSPLTLKKDVLYEITFDAFAASNRTITLNLGSGTAPSSSYFYDDITLSTMNQSFSRSFTMSESTTTTATLDFLFGQNHADFWIGNIVLREAGCVVPCEEIIEVSNPVYSKNYKADNNVNSSIIIPPWRNVQFSAGQSIDLLPGFEIRQGATFSSKIEACESEME